jgi:uncharacterized membrane protein
MRTQSPFSTYCLVLFSVVLWCACIVLAAVGASVSPDTGIAMYLYSFFANVCHQLPDRSLHFLGEPLGVCARCASIYGAFLLGLVCFPLVRSIQAATIPPRSTLVIALALLCGDVLLSWFGVYDAGLLTRTISGGLFGFVAAFHILPGLLISAQKLKRSSASLPIGSSYV